jgi:hypothetical protein
MSRTSFVVNATVLDPAGQRIVELRGQTARALLTLVLNGARGATALDVSNTWAYRFGAYVFDLRRDHYLTISTEREAHPGGWHARYRLLSPVRVLSISESGGPAKPLRGAGNSSGCPGHADRDEHAEAS